MFWTGGQHWSFCWFSFHKQITDLTEQNVLGRMFKRWAGCGRETFTDADTFGVTCKETFCFLSVLIKYKISWMIFDGYCFKNSYVKKFFKNSSKQAQITDKATFFILFHNSYYFNHLRYPLFNAGQWSVLPRSKSIFPLFPLFLMVWWWKVWF